MSNFEGKSQDLKVKKSKFCVKRCRFWAKKSSDEIKSPNLKSKSGFGNKMSNFEIETQIIFKSITQNVELRSYSRIRIRSKNFDNKCQNLDILSKFTRESLSSWLYVSKSRPSLFVWKKKEILIKPVFHLMFLTDGWWCFCLSWNQVVSEFVGLETSV